MRRYPRTLIIGGTYFDNPKPDYERQQKEKVFGGWFIWAGNVTSTTDEYTMIMAEAKKRRLGMYRIIIVDEEYHSIRARIVWKHNLPKAKLSFQLVSGKVAADRENPMRLQRSRWKWLLANLALAPFYKWWPGVKWWAKKNFNQSFK